MIMMSKDICDTCNHKMKDHVKLRGGGYETHACKICSCKTEPIRKDRSVKQKISVGIGITFVIFIVLGIMSVSISNEQDELQVESEADTPVEYSIGDSVIFDGISYNVTSVATSNSTRTVYGIPLPSTTPEATYVVVGIQAENLTKKAADVWDCHFVLVDSKEREFEDAGAIAFPWKGKNLQPGLPRRGTIGFDVPFDQGLEYKLMIRNSCHDFEDYNDTVPTPRVYINLGKLA